MGYKGNSVQGEIPESGAIFMSNIKTHKECLERKLFGLPSGMSNFVLHVKEGMTLFLFEYERRLLYGVFRATCDGEVNIEPKAFGVSGKHFPAQVRFTTVSDCSPLAENEFKDVIRGNYFSGKKFNFGLNRKQVRKLVQLFRSKTISKNHPERNIWRYDGKPSEGNARSGDLRMEIRHRIRFDSCDSRDDRVKEEDDNIYINKHIIESRHKDKREGFLTHYTTESDEFGDCGRHGILGKHFDPREKVIEEGYMPVFSKPHGNHLDEIGVGSGDFLMDDNKDIIDYNRLLDEYNVREGFRRSMNEHTLTNVFSHFNQDAYSHCDPTRTDIPDIQLSSSCFDEGSSFIPITDNLFYPGPERIPMSKSLPYYSHDEGSNRYLDDPGSHSSIFPKFISRNLSSDADQRMHEMDPTDNDFRSCEKYESKHSFGTTDKRVSVFSRLNLTTRHEEHAIKTDEKHDLNSSVDKVMKMLEKVVSSPKKRSGKSIPVIKQDIADNSHSKIEDYEFPDVKLEVDADVTYEVEGSVFQETRLVNFKRRNKSNRRIDDTSKENFECSVGAVRPAASDQLTGMPCKRRKLVRPAFVEKNFIPDTDSDHENTLSANDSANVVLECSERVHEFIKSMVPTCHENAPDNCNLTEAGIESLKKVDASIKLIDLNTPATSDESSSSKDDNNSTKVVLESQKSGNEDGNAESRLVSDVFAEGTTSKDDHKMCGWIEW